MIPINKPLLGEEEIRVLETVLRSGILTSRSGVGSNVVNFEEAYAKYVGTKYGVALNSGTAALHSCMLAANIGSGDEVIVPSFTFVATAEAVALVGARPVFVDIDLETYCINPIEIEEAITNKTRAIIPVHLYGLPADMDPIMEIAEKFNLIVIEDAAQAHGARYKNGKAGNLADMACFSFYGSKNMVTGEGGMVTSNNKEYAEKIRLIRSLGGEEGSRSIVLYHNYRMPELDAAIGFVQLGKLSQFLQARENNACILMEGLKDVEGIQLPKVPTGSRSAWHVFTIRLKKAADKVARNNVVRRLREKQVYTNVYYPKPVHLLPYYRKTYGSSKLPKTETAAKQVLSLPIHPSLTLKQLNEILIAVKTSINSIELD